MAAIAQSLPGSESRWTWFWNFLKNELAPYPGRGAVVARMVTASTLVMIVCMTFQIPYAAYAALFALNISRESIEGTTSAARAFVVGSALGGAYIIVCTMLIVGNAMLRFLWVGGTLLLVFYAISALSSYTESARFAYLAVIIIPFIDSHASAEAKVERTLWAVGAITLGSVSALLMEIVFAAFRRDDPLTLALTDRLDAVEDLLANYLTGRPLDTAAGSQIPRLASVGTSRMRRMVQRAGYLPQREQNLAGIVALVGRLVDLAASLPQLVSRIVERDRERVATLAKNVRAIRNALTGKTVPQLIAPPDDGEAPGVAMLVELESTVSLIGEAFTGAPWLAVYVPVPREEGMRSAALVPGALSNPEHIKFALRGCLAAGLCYVIYNGLFWPGIATSVVTCLLTALTTIGASHQKQVLRFTGAIIGGIVIGFGAQVFILPNMDSIGAFAVLFAAVAALSGWIATSTPRLSYLGTQIAVAFYLINLQEFKFQTSLSVARDRVVGVFLGLLMMWLAYDWLWTAPAGTEMREAFISAIRMLAQLAREPVTEDRREALESTYALREKINAQFDKVRSLADIVIFEFRAPRQAHLAMRDHIRKWQPQLRTLFLMRIASLKYRLQLRGFELPEAVLSSLKEYDQRSAAVLEDLADRIEAQRRSPGPIRTDLLQPLEQTVQAHSADQAPQWTAGQIQSFLTLLRKIDALTTSLAEQCVID